MEQFCHENRTNQIWEKEIYDDDINNDDKDNEYRLFFDGNCMKNIDCENRFDISHIDSDGIEGIDGIVGERGDNNKGKGNSVY